MTYVSKKTGNKRLLKLADFLEKLSDCNFDIECFTEYDTDKLGYHADFTGVIKNFKRIDCGTVACAIGWMPKVFPRLVKWDRFGKTISIRTGKDGFNAAEEIFALKGFDYYKLFTRHSYPKNPSAKQVAKRIREFVRERGDN